MASSLTFPVTPPTSPKPKAEAWKIKARTAATENAFNLTRRINSQDGQHWQVTVMLPVLSRDEQTEWIGFLAGVRGNLGALYWGPTTNNTPSGPMASDGGTPVVSDLGGMHWSGCDSLWIKGFDAGAVSDFALAGDWFEVDGYLYRLTENADKDSNGYVEFVFQPPLQTSPGHEAAVTITNPQAQFRLKGGMPWVGFTAEHLGTVSGVMLEALKYKDGDQYYNGWTITPDPFIEWDIYDELETYSAESPITSRLTGGRSSFKPCPDWKTKWILESDPLIEYAIFDDLEGYAAESPIVSTLDDEENLFGTSTGFESAWIFTADPLIEWEALDDLESYSAASPIVASLNGGTGFDGAWDFN